MDGKATVAPTHIHRYCFIATQSEIIVVGQMTPIPRTGFSPNQFCYWHLYHNELVSRGQSFPTSFTSSNLITSHTIRARKRVNDKQSKALFSPCSDHPHGRGHRNKHVLQSPCWSTEGINRWQVVRRISLMSLINILIVNLEGLLLHHG